MRFKSQYPAFQQFCRHYGPPVFNASGGLTREATPQIMVSFGIHGSEYTYIDPHTGRQETGADIRGGYFDSVEQQKIEGWTDEERELVERVLLDVCERIPEFVQLYEEPKAEPPWSNYDKAKPQRIAVLAAELGTDRIEQALVYERQNKNREAVLVALEDVKRETEPVAAEATNDTLTEDEDALIAAVS